MNPKVSVIIPVYNVEKYIITCMESVKNQTFKNFEVIFIDDGSTDNTLEIVNAYITEHSLENFKVISQNNQGSSSARNRGLDVAQGDWIFFLDADDWIENNALELLFNTSQEYDSDLIIGGYQAVDDISKEIELWSNFLYEYATLPENLDGLHSFSFCWGRLFKRKIIEKNNIRFDKRIAYAEDNAWHFDYNRYIKSYACINTVIYNYRINRDGAQTNGLVTPRMKYYIWEHFVEFVKSFDIGNIQKALKENKSFNRVAWGTITTAIVNDILDKNYSFAKQKQNMIISKMVIAEYKPRNKKDKLFLFLYNKSFLLLCVFVKIYYGNFEKMRRSKLVNLLSKGF